ncbi:MAG: tRNA (adenosine(37)-N6)-threonylcarbamoyltransferase complex ATPase subunit type 1 TsaE [Holosporaceae bacterium]|jgi:tRNA threonylcarbamoyladenosine biosynthesis protein TsaE|nr:tRNA (adenosine(37)-N6)-threonylcarbamoyltransferase complex ATPase subunit type 1 TsaE [Holosporaceae bacterium]
MAEFICNTLKDTRNAAEYFVQFAKIGQCFSLYGDLGCGKTTFSKYLIKALNKSAEDIQSPTFTLVQTYNSAIAEIWHVDCYRWQSAEEFWELGLEEALGNCIVIVEWPDIIQHLLPPNVIKIKFFFDGKIRRLEYEILGRQ